MNLTFDLAIVQDCVLRITDTTQEYDQYLEEDNNNYVRPGRFKYSDTATINVIKYVPYNKSLEDAEIYEVIITPHKQNGEIAYLDEAYHTLKKDGHYLIEHLVILTDEGVSNLNKVESTNSNIIGVQDYTNLYYTDGIKFYKNNQEEVKIEEILEVNSESISKVSQETFSICSLHKCYIEQCKNQFESMRKSRCVQYNNFDLDLLWMCINAIKYNIEFGRLKEAQSILEDITFCSNACKISVNNGCSCCR